jgi:hypothetical protein
MGRKKKSGARSEKTGRLLQRRDYGNDRVQARIERFRHFMGDGSIGTEMTCAGRLRLVGAFDGLHVDPDVILSALLDYQNRYWGHYRGGPAVGSLEPQDRGHDGGEEDPQTGKVQDRAGEWFDRIDLMLRNMGHASRKAVHEVTVDRHWFPDEDVGWAARIINSRILDKRMEMIRAGERIPPTLVVIGETACDSDWAMLNLLRDGALGMVDGPSSLRRAA